MVDCITKQRLMLSLLPSGVQIVDNRIQTGSNRRLRFWWSFILSFYLADLPRAQINSRCRVIPAPDLLQSRAVKTCGLFSIFFRSLLSAQSLSTSLCASSNVWWYLVRRSSVHVMQQWRVKCGHFSYQQTYHYAKAFLWHPLCREPTRKGKVRVSV